MSYTPYTWQSGDTVTAARLNNIEQGVANAGGAILNITATENSGSYSLGVSFADIKPYILNGSVNMFLSDGDEILVIPLYSYVEIDTPGDEYYAVNFTSSLGFMAFEATSSTAILTTT